MIIPSVHYYNFYLAVVTVLSVVAFIRYSWVESDNQALTKSNNAVPGLEYLVTLFAIIFIAYRNPYSLHFGDTRAYTWFFDRYAFYHGFEYHWDWDANNLLFDNLFAYMAYNYESVSSFYLVIAVIYFGGIWYACKRMFPKDSFAALMVFLGAFTTFAGATNGIKNGAAASLFLIALALNDSRDKMSNFFCYVFIVLCIGFHHAMRVPVAAFVICKFINKSQIYTVFWIACLIMAAFHITFFQDLFVDIGEDIGDDKIVGYLGNESTQTSSSGISGFRYDFVLYSVVPIIVGWIAVYAKKIDSERFKFLLNVYTLTNAVWLLCMYGWFTNRIAALSWMMYPIVLIYPFLKENWGENKYNIFKLVAYGHLAFTLFMNFVYYAS